MDQIKQSVIDSLILMLQNMGSGEIDMESSELKIAPEWDDGNTWTIKHSFDELARHAEAMENDGLQAGVGGPSPGVGLLWIHIEEEILTAPKDSVKEMEIIEGAITALGRIPLLEKGSAPVKTNNNEPTEKWYAVAIAPDGSETVYQPGRMY